MQLVHCSVLKKKGNQSVFIVDFKGNKAKTTYVIQCARFSDYISIVAVNTKAYYKLSGKKIGRVRFQTQLYNQAFLIDQIFVYVNLVTSMTGIMILYKKYFSFSKALTI